MAKKQRKYDMEYKIQAVKLAKELGGAKAAAKLDIPENTIYAWTKAAREQEKEIRRLKEENGFPEEASAFFAASRQKSAKGREGCSLP